MVNKRNTLGRGLGSLLKSSDNKTNDNSNYNDHDNNCKHDNNHGANHNNEIK